jgi:ribosomal protein L11 methyltransferase
MNWIQVSATIKPWPDDVSPFVSIFDEFGIENTAEEGQVLWGCYVDTEGAPNRVEELKEALLAAGAATVTSAPFEEQNWDEVWRSFFHARRIGQRFVVVPTWEEYETEAGDLVILLDPGQAFGTGDHPTTRMCLALLENVGCDGKLVADIGCGSGILSIGARLLGARKVLAVDIEEQSVEVSRENAALNRVEFEAFCGNGVEVIASEGPFDLIVSNIISATLINLAPDMAYVSRPGTDWILSGVIEKNWPDVRAAAEKRGFEVIEFQQEDDWISAWLRKQ